MKNKGFVAITSVLIIAAVALSVTVSIALLAVSNAQNSLDFKKGFEAFKYAESCGDEGLIRVRNDPNFTGGTITLPNGECTISITTLSGGYQIDAVGTITGPPSYVKKIQITSQQDGNGIAVVTWQEVE